MWLFRIFARKKKPKKSYETEPDSFGILTKNLHEEFMQSKRDKDMEVLIEVYKPKARGKIETLISLEKELAAQRKEISSELHKHSKGKW